MARRKPPKTTGSSRPAKPQSGSLRPAEAPVVPPQASGDPDPHAKGLSSASGSPSLPILERGAVPSTNTMRVISVAVGIHLFALFLSYSAIIEPSSTHAKWLAGLAPYLRSTHFAADGRPYYLAHSGPDEQPHRLQIASAEGEPGFTITPQTEWTTVRPGGTVGLAAWDRYARWMTLAASLAESEQPSLAAALLEPLVAGDPKIQALRIVRLPTELTSTADTSEQPIYVAYVKRSGDQVRLVSVQSPRLTTFPRNAENETDSGPEADAK